ncbi:MAG: hypothetical protein K6A15_10830 [Treponema sp.]|nr:hypothetical protein [Treponema sp.]
MKKTIALGLALVLLCTTITAAPKKSKKDDKSAAPKSGVAYMDSTPYAFNSYIDTSNGNQSHYADQILDSNLHVSKGETLKVKISGKVSKKVEMFGVNIHDVENPVWSDFGGLWAIKDPLPVNETFLKEYNIKIDNDSGNKPVSISLNFRDTDNSQGKLIVENLIVSWEKTNATIANAYVKKEDNKTYFNNLSRDMGIMSNLSYGDLVEYTISGTPSEDTVITNIYVLNNGKCVGISYDINIPLKKNVPFKKTFRRVVGEQVQKGKSWEIAPDFLCVNDAKQLIIKDYEITFKPAAPFEKEFDVHTHYNTDWGRITEYNISLNGISFNKGDKLVVTFEGIADADAEFFPLFENLITLETYNSEVGDIELSEDTIKKDKPFRITAVFPISKAATAKDNVTLVLSIRSELDTLHVKNFNATWKVTK